jgi:hypothetical protein
MKWLASPIDRVAQRPHYEKIEPDHEREEIVVAFLSAHHGHVDCLISPNDLCILIEPATADFDECAELTVGVGMFCWFRSSLALTCIRWGGLYPALRLVLMPFKRSPWRPRASGR